MKLLRYVAENGEVHIGVGDAVGLRRLPVATIAEFLSGDLARCDDLVARAQPATAGIARVLAPVDGTTEVWAAGVTYRRSRDARVEETYQPDIYERVYDARRPELFFKAAAWRVSGPGEAVAVRADSTMDVPEPELALAITASGEIAGHTICNDISSRSIEGDNPLYLPQAKTYAGSCALGPGILLSGSGSEPAPRFRIELEIRRGAQLAWYGRSDTASMVRPLTELVAWLFAELDFPTGAILSTGTGIVPDLGFSLLEGDEVTIRIPEIGTLTNPVVRGKQDLLGRRLPTP